MNQDSAPRLQPFYPWILLALRFLLGGVFAAAGLAKLLEPVENFQAVLEHYEMIPAFLIPGLARVIPWTEWLAGMFLLSGYMTRFFSLVLAFASAWFIIFLSLAYISGHAPESCGCFGTQGIHLAPWQMMIVDAVNLLSGIWLFRCKKHFCALENIL